MYGKQLALFEDKKENNFSKKWLSYRSRHEKQSSGKKADQNLLQMKNTTSFQTLNNLAAYRSF